MFDVLIREVAARFGLGDKARELVQMLLASMFNTDTGGLGGFLEKFKAAGLGSVVQSWLGDATDPQPVTNDQVEQVLGGTGGLLSQLTSRLNAPRDGITGAVGFLLPVLISKLTPGGNVPSGVPAEVQGLIGDGRAFLTAAPAAAATAPVAAASGGGGIGKWLPWIIGIAAVLLGLTMCNKPGPTPVAPAAPAATSAPATPPPVVETAPAAPAPAVEPAAAAPVVEPAPAPAPAAMEAPDHAAVIADMVNDVPMLRVFFDVAKTDVAAEFGDKSKDLVDYLNANAGANAVISGFNDPTGNAAQNAELAKNRAEAVQAALAAAGIAKERLLLEKPADTSPDVGASNAALRRVDVTIRQ